MKDLRFSKNGFMTIKAKFTGSENDILGYILGKEYELMLLEKGANSHSTFF
ncbi:MAG TPA: hypothetical protein VMZ91_16540 [Candidatus Paceibacterota bacterium]|nr:hypothetical protein [Candidatus Paceibacterota bacterium]